MDSEGTPEVNPWHFCTVCGKNLKEPCPKCEEIDSEEDEPCWVLLDNVNGYRHTHCSFADYNDSKE